MNVPFIKYSSCSNDFILIDNRELELSLSSDEIQNLCHRREGIGADGVLMLEPSSLSSCKMRIYNADGSEAEMCGNGIRCVADFLRYQYEPIEYGVIDSICRQHKFFWEGDQCSIEMGSPKDILWNKSLLLSAKEYTLTSINTGVPHAVLFSEEIETYPLTEIGPAIRYHKDFATKGTNVTVAKVMQNGVAVRTYERGVEGETPACGTGATAAALVAAEVHSLKSPVNVFFQSGDQVEIGFSKIKGGFSSVTMKGACKRIFTGCFEYNSNKFSFQLK